MDWLYAILALSSLIVIHEFGHYVAARIGGMHVDTFSVLGIGPVIVELGEYKGTRFVLSAIPFGAYVHIVGMEPEDDENDPKLSPEEQRAVRVDKAAAANRAKEMGYSDYRDRPLWARALALFGGPGANYLAAMFIAVAVFVGFGMPTQVQITSFADDSGAQAAGLQTGDAFVRIGDLDVVGASPSLLLNEATSNYRGQTVEVTVRRGDNELTEPVALATEGPALGVNLGVNFVQGSVGAAIYQGVKYPFIHTKIQLNGLWSMITGKTSGKVGGPVAIARTYKQSLALGLPQFLLFGALISTVLGMFNLLPLPALDGGRLFFLGIEAISGRKVSQTVEGWIHASGLIALLGFLLVVTVFDVKELVQDEPDQATTQTAAPPADDDAKLPEPPAAP